MQFSKMVTAVGLLIGMLASSESKASSIFNCTTVGAEAAFATVLGLDLTKNFGLCTNSDGSHWIIQRSDISGNLGVGVFAGATYDQFYFRAQGEIGKRRVLYLMAPKRKHVHVGFIIAGSHHQAEDINSRYDYRQLGVPTGASIGVGGSFMMVSQDSIGEMILVRLTWPRK